MRLLTCVVFGLVAGCDAAGDDPSDPDAAPLSDVSGVDMATPDAAPLDAAPPDAGPPGPADYCEATVDAFCPFYLRCGRMAVPDLASCRAVFLQNCNAVYEPVYAALAEAGLLALDASAIEACAVHLEAVECAAQIFDLDGPCGEMWVGRAEAGQPCAPGIESFVCAPGTTCVLGLDFCGACEPVVPVGADCANARCGPEARCLAETCVARAGPGRPCGEAGCVAGAGCVDGVCAGPDRPALGEPCARGRGCPYKAACVEGVCVEAARIDEACDAGRPCAGGACVDGICVAPAGAGAACTSGAACVGQVCADGECASVPGACF